MFLETHELTNPVRVATAILEMERGGTMRFLGKRGRLTAINLKRGGGVIIRTGNAAGCRLTT